MHFEKLGMMVVVSSLTCSAAVLAHEGTRPHHQETSIKAAKGFTPLPQKANGVRVEKAYRLESVPQKGQPLTITLHLNSYEANTSFKVTVDAGLVLNSTQQAVALPHQKRLVAQVVVTPTEDGLFYVNVFTMRDGAQSVASIPVQVGNKIRAMHKSLKTEPNGEKVIVMPAK